MAIRDKSRYKKTYGVSLTEPNLLDSTDDDLFTIEGYQVVANAAARNLIPEAERFEGLTVKTLDNERDWLLKAGPWTYTNSDWVLVSHNNTFIFDSTVGSPTDNVFNDFDTLYGELQRALGEKIIFLATVSASPVLSAQVYDLSQTRIIGLSSTKNAFTIPTGATIKYVTGLNNLTITGAGTGYIELGSGNSRFVTSIQNCVMPSSAPTGGAWVRVLSPGEIRIRNVTTTATINTFGMISGDASTPTLDVYVDTISDVIPSSVFSNNVGTKIRVYHLRGSTVSASQVGISGTFEKYTQSSILVYNNSVFKFVGDNINFLGTGVLVDGSGNVTINNGVTVSVLDNGSPINANAATLNFTGGATAVNNPGQNRVDINLSNSNLELQSGGSVVQSNTSKLNFIGGGVTVTPNGAGKTDVSVPGILIKDNNSTVATVPTLDFYGATIVENDIPNTKVKVTIPGLTAYSQGSLVGASNKINFNSPAISALYDSGNDRIDVGFLLYADKEVLSPAYSISLSPASTLLEVSQTLSLPSFIASRNYIAESAILTNTYTGEAKDVLSSFNAGTTPSPNAPASSAAFASSITSFLTTFGNTVTFTLTVKRLSTLITRTATSTYLWGQRVYFGAAIPGAANEAFIKALPFSTVQTVKAGTYNITAGPGQRIYVALRTAYGTPIIKINGMSGGFTQVTTPNVTNNYGFMESYSLYQSETDNLGSVIITVE